MELFLQISSLGLYVLSFSCLLWSFFTNKKLAIFFTIAAIACEGISNLTGVMVLFVGGIKVVWVLYILCSLMLWIQLSRRYDQLNVNEY